MNTNDFSDFKYKSVYKSILPDNKRTKEKKEKKMKEEEERRLKAEEEMKTKQEREKQINLDKVRKEKQKKDDMEKKRLEELKKQEELQQISTLKGQFGHMISNLKKNDTTLDYTISGLDLRPAQIRILVKAIEQNITLKGLLMTRKKIQDSEGREIANYLKRNDVLERLELEGNMLGPQTLKGVAELLKENQSLRIIDLEGNDLTLSGSDISGVEELARSLEVNDSLLSLNLCNTGLDKRCSEIIKKMLEKNQTLIILDIDQNPQMDLNDVRQIQTRLINNKKSYDEERYKEFIERRKMWNEQNISNILQSNMEAKKVLQDNVSTRIEAKRIQMEENWQNKLEQDEINRQKQIAKLDKEAKLRTTKKKKRRGKKKA